MRQVDLRLGDCIEVMHGLPENSVDLTVTSPPYDNLRTYAGTLEWGEHIWKPVLSELFRLTKPGGVVVWVVNDATINGSETGTSFRQALYAMECGFNVETMIWEKTGSGALGSNNFYGQNFEFMFIFVKGTPKTRNFIKDRVNKKQTGIVKVNSNLDASRRSKARIITRQATGKRTNIWRMDPKKNADHPAPFPEQLANDHIISWSNPGDVVFDPFMGSGTTGKMAVLNGRHFIGVEKVPEYMGIAKQRISEANTK